MKFNIKLILYFGFGGILPSIFFSVMNLIENDFEGNFFTTCGNFFVNAMEGYVITVIVTSLVMLSLGQINRFFPWNKSPYLRFTANFIITPIVAMISMFPLALFTFWLGLSFAKESLKEHIISLEVTALIMDFILVGVYEGYNFFLLWKNSLVRNEQLEKENIASKYEALKNQLNPHFLFNSLNTVSSLIHEDPDKAEEFIDEFSKIYRVILEHQDKSLHPLKCEISFVESYLKLQKIRFGESLNTHFEIDASKQEMLVPTLSIQLLVENAIKHNKVTKEFPLTIVVVSDGDLVLVKNNLQIRENSLTSTGIGLNNLTARYQMLTTTQPIFVMTENEYIAKLPLIPEE